MIKQEFTLVNNTGVVINSLYVSPADDDNWEEDILEEDQLADGESVTITFESDADAEAWDLMVEDEEGNELMWEDLDLANARTVTLSWDGDSGTAEIT